VLGKLVIDYLVIGDLNWRAFEGIRYEAKGGGGMRPRVLIVMGSDSDMPVMEETVKILKKLGISYETVIASAHRTPERTTRLASEAEDKGIEVIIAGAGMAAHLAGVLAAHTIVPVIGVPIDSPPLNGLDSLLSTVQMPFGVPVATMAIGKAGAKNAAIFSAQIIGRKDPEVVKRLKGYRKKMAEEVEKKSRTLQGYNN
jgi:phosphoribosylaminoimidazole carboxylase PurE protein